MVAAAGLAAPTAAGVVAPEPDVALAASEVALDVQTLLQQLLRLPLSNGSRLSRPNDRV